MKKLTLINDMSIDKVSAEKTESEDHQKKINEFLKFYEDHGFGGRKKK